MTPTDTNLPHAAVCAIIEACGKSGVRVLKYGNLYLAFGPAAEKIVQEISYPLISANDSLQSMPDHKKQNQDALEHDELDDREEKLRMLLIENPMEYERLLREGELDDEPTEPDDGEA